MVFKRYFFPIWEQTPASASADFIYIKVWVAKSSVFYNQGENKVDT
jgi:hypothetical protein